MTTRQELRQRGEEMRARLFGPQSVPLDEAVPGFRALMSETAYGGVWSRPGLALRDRMVCTLAVISALQRTAQLETHVPAALDLGLKPFSILEIFLQSGLYAGFGTTEESATLAARIFAQRGVSAPDLPPRDDALEALSARGSELLSALHGDRGLQGYAAPDNPVTGALYPTIQYGYGELWFRPGLERPVVKVTLMS